MSNQLPKLQMSLLCAYQLDLEVHDGDNFAEEAGSDFVPCVAPCNFKDSTVTPVSFDKCAVLHTPHVHALVEAATCNVVPCGIECDAVHRLCMLAQSDDAFALLHIPKLYRRVEARRRQKQRLVRVLGTRTCVKNLKSVLLSPWQAYTYVHEHLRRQTMPPCVLEAKTTTAAT
jgi:hypothetical protein